MPRVYEVTTDPAWIDPIVTAAAALDHAQRCNQGAVAGGALELSYPSAEQLLGYMEQGTDDVIVAHDALDLDGYLVVRKAVDIDGCIGKWVGVFQRPQTGQVAASIYRGLLQVSVDRYGWVRGRVSNDALREWLRTTMPGKLHPLDPTVICFPADAEFPLVPEG